MAGKKEFPTVLVLSEELYNILMELREDMSVSSFEGVAEIALRTLRKNIPSNKPKEACSIPYGSTKAIRHFNQESVSSTTPDEGDG